jgi:hypothetical protein
VKRTLKKGLKVLEMVKRENLTTHPSSVLQFSTSLPLKVQITICVQRREMPKGKTKSKGKGKASSSSAMTDVAAVYAASKRLAPVMLSAFKGAVSFFNPEVKHADVIVNNAVSTTTLVSFLSGISQGDSNTTRDGNSVKITGFYGDIIYVINASATSSRVRTLIVVDTQMNGATVTAADVFDTSGSAMLGLINVDSFPGRFIVLYDEVDLLAISTEKRLIHRRISLPSLVNMHLKFNTGTGNGTTAAVGPHIFMLQLSTEATNTVSQESVFRLSFLDN